MRLKILSKVNLRKYTMLSSEYFNDPRMSQSKLKKILDGVEEFKYNLENPPETTDPMRLGTAVHLLTLQPELSIKIAGIEKIDRRTKEGKESFLAQQEMIAKYPDNIFLCMEDFKKAHDMAASVRLNSDALQILNCCESFEKIHFFNYLDIDFKCQADGVGSEFIVDLKTTRCENNEFKIRQEIWNQKYHFQAACYLEAFKKTDYYIIFVRNEPPYSVFPIKLSAEMLEQGKSLFDEACELYKDCLKNNPEFKSNNRLRII